MPQIFNVKEFSESWIKVAANSLRQKSRGDFISSESLKFLLENFQFSLEKIGNLPGFQLQGQWPGYLKFFNIHWGSTNPSESTLKLLLGSTKPPQSSLKLLLGSTKPSESSTYLLLRSSVSMDSCLFVLIDISYANIQSSCLINQSPWSSVQIYSK